MAKDEFAQFSMDPCSVKSGVFEAPAGSLETGIFVATDVRPRWIDFDASRVRTSTSMTPARISLGATPEKALRFFVAAFRGNAVSSYVPPA
jgi:hypothetical protein